VSCAFVEAVGEAYMNIHEFPRLAHGTAHFSSRSSFLSRLNFSVAFFFMNNQVNLNLLLSSKFSFFSSV